MSPTTQLVHKKVLMDRAQLLLAGRDLDLMKQMSRDERRWAISNHSIRPVVCIANSVRFRATADWLHDFWMFSFVTTKYWGKGPKNWTLPLINFKTLAGVVDGSPENHRSRSLEHGPTQSPSMATGVIEPPTQLCNWSIHLTEINYEPIKSQPSIPANNNGDQFDVEDESTWREWNDQHGRDLTSTITQGLQDNVFTTHQAEDVPIAIDLIVNTVSGSMKDAKVEAIGFAIMTRNHDALIDLLEERDFNREALRTISPFHLAARFLDGSKACCGVMWDLVSYLSNQNSIGINYTDDSGMTVLDALFMTILRSHTSVSPPNLGTKFFTPGSNFEGVDVDICGRWDADSPCVRALHAAGETSIPKDWKHIFCHTSAQAVCHSLTAIFMELWAPDINTRSGLFQRRCRSCGLELKLGPLHSFVVVCFHLASASRPGETLFGMLACLVCLLTLRADPSLSAEISLPTILELGETEECQHQPFNAAELASAVPSAIVNTWTPEVKLGWEAIKDVLIHSVRRAQTEVFNTTEFSFNNSTSSGVVYDHNENSEGGYSSDSDDQSCPHGIHEMEGSVGRELVKCGDIHLGIIWAAIQVELLTYRRLQDGDPWLSSKFDLQDVAEGLRASDDSILMRLVKNHGDDAFEGFSHCGLFLDVLNEGCARREEACASYFANLDDWKRTTFIPARYDEGDGW